MLRNEDRLGMSTKSKKSRKQDLSKYISKGSVASNKSMTASMPYQKVDPSHFYEERKSEAFDQNSIVRSSINLNDIVDYAETEIVDE